MPISKPPLSKVYKKGLVLVVKDFKFSNGAKPKAKYFVLLNATAFSEPIMYMLPTTQLQHYTSRRSNHLYFELKHKESKCFTKTNVFDFDQIAPMEYEDFELIYNCNDTLYKGCLESNIVEKINQFVRKSGLSDEYKKIILGSAP